VDTPRLADPMRDGASLEERVADGGRADAVPLSVG
jgi:hypothetical protein